MTQLKWELTSARGKMLLCKTQICVCSVSAFVSEPMHRNRSTGSRCSTRHAANSPRPDTTTPARHAAWQLKIKTNCFLVMTEWLGACGNLDMDSTTQKCKTVMWAPSVSIQLADWLEMEVKGCGAGGWSFIFNHSAGNNQKQEEKKKNPASLICHARNDFNIHTLTGRTSHRKPMHRSWLTVAWVSKIDRVTLWNPQVKKKRATVHSQHMLRF